MNRLYKSRIKPKHICENEENVITLDSEIQTETQ